MRSFPLLAHAALALLVASGAATAQDNWPQKPIRLIVPYAAGSGVDSAMRPVATALGAQLQQPVLVDNRAGAGGLVGTQALANAAPDGYTVAFGNIVTLAINPSFHSDLPYDPSRLTPVGLASGSQYVLIARPDFPASTFPELIAYARENPGKVFVGSPGHGSGGHLAAALIETETGASFSMVPYKTGTQAVGDMLNGQLDVMIDNIVAVLPFINDQRVKPLAVTGLKRASTLPDVPTIHEDGLPGFEVLAWGGLVAPEGTPPELVDHLNAALRKALEDPAVIAMAENFSIDLMPSSPEEFTQLIQDETRRWAEVVRYTGVTAN
ncbi:MAG: tripartite tricarboxylate transporter substrate binding protein [Pigmentiphaga sp.]|nr:tripartite tricarboxylate transporter substrate binding protein [Pigmentiphaga sp.]